MNSYFYRRLTISLGLLLALGAVISQPLAYAQTDASAKSNILFILDGSSSMWSRIDNTPKIVIAKKVMTNLIQQLPDNIAAGLEAYGHRSKDDCNDIEIVSPVGESDNATLAQRIQSIQPKGKTPLTEALKLAAEQLKSADDETTVVLISDGHETCGGDPCTLVRDLRGQDIKLKVHVVGFDISKEEHGQLECIADAGGGKYFSAQNANQLQDALTKVQEEVLQNKGMGK